MINSSLRISPQSQSGRDDAPFKKAEERRGTTQPAGSGSGSGSVPDSVQTASKLTQPESVLCLGPFRFLFVLIERHILQNLKNRKK